jgi:uncharacterized membrane protein
MNATIGIYENHDKAVDAVVKLKDAGFPVKQLSILGKAQEEVVDDKLHVMEKDPLKVAGIGTGTVVGTALGVLTGVGLFAIPGVGFLYGAGALVGAIAGFDFGLIGGGIATVLATVGVKEDYAKKYHDELEAGKFIVVAHGSKEEVAKASEIMNTHDQHLGVATH